MFLNHGHYRESNTMSLRARSFTNFASLYANRQASTIPGLDLMALSQTVGWSSSSSPVWALMWDINNLIM